ISDPPPIGLPTIQDRQIPLNTTTFGSRLQVVLSIHLAAERFLLNVLCNSCRLLFEFPIEVHPLIPFDRFRQNECPTYLLFPLLMAISFLCHYGTRRRWQLNCNGLL